MRFEGSTDISNPFATPAVPCRVMGISYESRIARILICSVETSFTRRVRDYSWNDVFSSVLVPMRS